MWSTFGRLMVNLDKNVVNCIQGYGENHEVSGSNLNGDKQTLAGYVAPQFENKLDHIQHQPANMREALTRQFEKELIREEIIAEEIGQRRMLEFEQQIDVRSAEERIATSQMGRRISVSGFGARNDIGRLDIVPFEERISEILFINEEIGTDRKERNPKVIDGIKIELFGATTITRKIILEGGLFVVGDGSGSGSGAAVEANDALLTVFGTTNHYDYDHTSCTDFSLDFATSSECSVYKCQTCKAKHDRVINVINALTASAKEMTSKRGVIP
ncbi:hypothetical protein BC332_00952 [Capsicum chinense]|nr:hypothetical protein BC332_00952 [Capsicum chinense]